MATKSATIILRADPDLKARIEAAAGRLGKSLTRFMLEAAESAARKVEAMPTKMEKPRGKGACPTFFRALCQEAAQGGARGYADAGKTLASTLASLAPDDLDGGGWGKELEALLNLVSPPGEGRRDDDAVWAWFEKHLPRCTALVPARRRKQFLAGVYEAADEEVIEW